MKEQHYFFVPDADKAQELPDDEAKHALRVLRVKAGDTLWLMDGKGKFYEAEATITNNKHCYYQIRNERMVEKAWSGRIHLAIAPTKMMERMEWMAEKATEVGMDQLTFLDCKFSERKTIRTDRVDHIVISAVKQSRKPFKPLVEGMVTFQNFISLPHEGKLFIAHCYEEVDRKDLFNELQQTDINEDVTVMVGPEGDFSIDEVRAAIDSGAVSVSLGEARLRTETAGLMAVTMAQLTKRIQR
ncbi:MAG: 16S rRNA (uracil(1498)-N(3))-methyltransferase [Prevotella sp.]|jgi:16S rRNA (uracil1498-N3)-methyltransferase